MNTPDENVESSPTTEAESAEVEQVETPVTTETPEGSAAETPEPKKVTETQKRINTLTRKRHEAEQETERLRQENERLKAQTVESEPQAPEESAFETDAEFQVATAKYGAELAAHKATTAVRAETQASTQAQLAAARESEVATKKQAFEANVESKRDNFADFDQVAYNHQFMDSEMAEIIFDMDKGPEVAYHLGSNLDEAARIHALPAVLRARELTKIEFQVEALKPKVVSGAPDPITPLGQSETVDTVGVNGENIKDADAWRQWDYERQLAKRAK